MAKTLKASRATLYRIVEKNEMLAQNDDSITSVCKFCGTTQKLCIHHILPIKQGGTNDSSNLIHLCLSCHSKLHKSFYNKLSINNNTTKVSANETSYFLDT
ncbi:MAG: HNH endonuclease [Nanoarchaeota archaeon]|nr:HNH endonuclease [Nanoarchaeota archaeon]